MNGRDELTLRARGDDGRVDVQSARGCGRGRHGRDRVHLPRASDRGDGRQYERRTSSRLCCLCGCG